MAEIGQLVEAGAVAFTDDGAPVGDAELMRRAFEYCLMFDKAVLNHTEVRELTQHGVMHEGLVSMVLGLAGMPAAAEDVMTSRDIALAEATGGRLHIMHVSTSNSVDALRRAKSRGVRVTAEATPHHFTLTDECLRTLRRELQDESAAARPGTRRCGDRRTDRRHDRRDRQRSRPARQGKEDAGTRPGPLRHRRPGNVARAGHHEADRAGPSRLARPRFAKCRSNPARILGINKGTLQIGADADVTVIDPKVRWTVDPSKFRSKSANTPFAGWELTGRAEVVIVGGRVKFSHRPGKGDGRSDLGQF